MIFVTVGAAYYPFDRLLRALDHLPGDEELVVQHGTSRVRPRGARCVDYLPFEELVEHVRSARAVVTHGGVGSILIALANGKRPLVVPRLRKFGEAVDDHQLSCAWRMDQASLVTLVEDPARLPEALAESDPDLSDASLGGGRLASELRAYLHAHVGVEQRNGGRAAEQVKRSS